MILTMIQAVDEMALVHIIKGDRVRSSTFVGLALSTGYCRNYNLHFWKL